MEGDKFENYKREPIGMPTFSNIRREGVYAYGDYPAQYERSLDEPRSFSSESKEGQRSKEEYERAKFLNAKTYLYTEDGEKVEYLSEDEIYSR